MAAHILRHGFALADTENGVTPSAYNEYGAILTKTPSGHVLLILTRRGIRCRIMRILTIARQS